MTFKEELTAKANKTQDIQPHLNKIKEELQLYFKAREYRITIYKPKCGPFAFGGLSRSHGLTLVCPRELNIGEYTKLFIEEFNKLGFTSKDLTLSGSMCETVDIQNIILTIKHKKFCK